MTPIRVQLSRKRGAKMPPNTISVARPSRWGNPHRVGYCPICGVEHTAEEAVAEFREMIEDDPEAQEMIRRDLAGKNLACYCKLSDVCHGDVLLEIANREEK